MLYWVATFAALGGFLYGYDLALIGGALFKIRDEFHLTQTGEELVVGSAKIGAFFGTFLGGAMMLQYGRRRTIAIDSLFYAAGPLVMAGSFNVASLIVGRLLVGVGIGISAVAVPTYLGEVAPAAIRGRLVELYEVLLCAGMLGSVLADVMLMHVPGNWRWMVGLPLVPSVVMAFGLFILPESPRWLVVNLQLDEALSVIHRMYTRTKLPEGAQNSTAEVEHELLNLWSSVEKDRVAVAARQAEMWRSRTRADPGQGPLKKATTLLRGTSGQAKRFHMLQHDQRDLHSTPKQDAAEGGAAGLELAPVANRHLQAGLEQGNPPQGAIQQPAAWDGAVTAAREDAGEYAGAGAPGPQEPGAAQQQQQQQQRGSPHSSGLGAAQEAASPASSVASALDPGLYRSLSQVPKGLPPIRTRSCSEPAGIVMPQKGFGGQERWQRRKERNRRLPSPTSRQEGFWQTLSTMLHDIWTVAAGPERRAVRLALCLAFFNQGCASTAIINYAPEVLEQAGVSDYSDATLWTSSITAVKIIGVFASVMLIDSAGRRPLLIWGSGAAAASMALLALADHLKAVPAVIFAMCLFIFAYSISFAGVFWVIVSEIFSMSAKSPAVSAATAMLFLAGAVANLVFLTLHSWLGAGSFLVFAGITAAGCLYCYLEVPETKGRTLAEVQALLGTEAREQHAALPHMPGAAQAPRPSRDGQGQSLLPAGAARSDAREAGGQAAQGRRQPQALASDWAGPERDESPSRPLV